MCEEGGTGTTKSIMKDPLRPYKNQKVIPYLLLLTMDVNVTKTKVKIITKIRPKDPN